MNIKSVGIMCVLLSSACGTPTSNDVASTPDVPNAMADGSGDVPNAPRDVPNGLDVANIMRADIPNVSDVPNVIADTGGCAMGTMACGMAGCVDSQTNVNHCGMCGNACPPGLVCSSGACVVLCQPPLVRCGDACIDTVNNPAHCGACANRCVAANATPVCLVGACNLICAPNFSNCDNDVANGCESNTTSSTAHCGRCGNACPMNQMCVAGVCALDCPMPNSICGAGAMMTCSNLQSDPANCAMCGNACSVTNGRPGCNAGACILASCNAGFGDCDGIAGNGCETDTNSAFSNCGACGILCPPPLFCSRGACRF